MARIVFITGTDTGVGKTLFTCLLLRHLRRCQFDAVGLKPLCSGDRGDIRALRQAQDGCLDEAEICPWYFSAPLTPLVAAGPRPVPLRRVVTMVQRHARRHEWILVEGAGGLLSPLGRGWSAAELISEVGAEVLVVASDRLGTINHTRLTVEVLERRELWGSHGGVVLSGCRRRGDRSVGSNEQVLSCLLGDRWLGKVPWLGLDPFGVQGVKKAKKILQKTLARLSHSYSFSAAL